jgi:hypothetical protein
MTSSVLAVSFSATQHKPAVARKVSKADLRRELEEMAEVMVQEDGLVNVAQAAILLDVSRERVYELIELGKLKPFQYTGRTYISFRQLKERREHDVKAGRPRRNLFERAKVSVEASLKADATQAKQGGFRGPVEKKKRKRRK